MYKGLPSIKDVRSQGGRVFNQCGQGQGRRQKNFQGRPTKKRSKNSKKYRKVAILSLFQEGGSQRKKNTEK